MERLQTLLNTYIAQHRVAFSAEEWTSSYSVIPFPLYWRVVYTIAERLPRDTKVVEIGSGFGFITSIFAYLGFANIIGFEQRSSLCQMANMMLADLFRSGELIVPIRFDRQYQPCDILVLVNCVYHDGCSTKEAYKQKLVSYYQNAGAPSHYLLEVIDADYHEPNDDYPAFVRLSSEDIHQMFPGFKIRSWPTYRFPVNKKSKTLYLIEKQ